MESKLLQREAQDLTFISVSDTREECLASITDCCSLIVSSPSSCVIMELILVCRLVVSVVKVFEKVWNRVELEVVALLSSKMVTVREVTYSLSCKLSNSSLEILSNNL